MRIRIIKDEDGNAVSWFGRPITIAECHELMGAIDMYTKALNR
jgi:hypothetical protein